MSNANLHNAQKNEFDEFYTQLEDIEAELGYYSKHFKGKTVFCNCDDPFESNFTLYFLMHFNKLGLRRLISTGYATSPIAGRLIKQLGTYCLDISSTKHFLRDGQKDLSQSDAIRMIQLEEQKCIKILSGDDEHLAGDFRSAESINLLKMSDIVVGNPPFSLFQDFINLLIKHKKKYLFIGDVNQVTYKEFFPLLQKGETWMGVTMNGTGSHWFEVPDTYQNENVQIVDGKRLMTNGRACWWTNLDYKERHTLTHLGYQYYGHEQDYPKYDNYDIIDIGYTTKNGKRRGDFLRTPYDYEGIMGVPTTALGKICPEQFEIVGIQERDDKFRTKVYSKKDYKNASDMNRAGVIFINGVAVMPYRRMFVKAKQPGRTDWETWQKEIDNALKEKEDNA